MRNKKPKKRNRWFEFVTNSYKKNAFISLDPKSPTFQSGDERNVEFEYTKKPRALARGLTGFTLMELLIVIVILGILATLSVTQYLSARERALDREAEANLKLVLAAERTYRMEDATNNYIPLNSTALTNQFLKLLLPQDATRAWDYFVHTQGGGSDFCAQATRTVGGRTWSIIAPTGGSPDPQPQKGVACGY